MEKKINELKQEPKDPNSPESQAFLRDLQKKIIEHQEKMKKTIVEWQEEDRQNAAKRN